MQRRFKLLILGLIIALHALFLFVPRGSVQQTEHGKLTAENSLTVTIEELGDSLMDLNENNIINAEKNKKSTQIDEASEAARGEKIGSSSKENEFAINAVEQERKISVVKMGELIVPAEIASISGTVIVEVTVGIHGENQQTLLISSVPGDYFDNIVLNAVKNAKFKEAIKNNIHVSGVIKLRFDFAGDGLYEVKNAEPSQE